MNIYIAFFRGINVGGRNILPMKDLVKILKEMGCEKVKTYIQSGNVVFQKREKAHSKFAGEVSSKILKCYGFKPTVLLLEIEELQVAIENNPYNTKDGKALHFFFLDTVSEQPDLEKLTSVKLKTEEFKLIKNIFYLYAPDGVGRSKVASKVEQCLGVPVTARNWNTVRNLFSIARQI